MEPRLLLLDEPLSNLDAKLRERMRFELKRTQRELGITTVYVTHDQSEALALSHEIAVMSEGRIVQVGSPREVYEQPRSRFVADFVGATNFLDATVVAADRDGGCRVGTPLGELNVRCVDRLEANAAVAVSVRPEDVELFETGIIVGNDLREECIETGECLHAGAKIALCEPLQYSRCFIDRRQYGVQRPVQTGYEIAKASLEFLDATARRQCGSRGRRYP